MSDKKFVYFDIGGVLLIDFSGNQKWVEMKRDLGITPEKDKIFDQVWEKYRPYICLDCDVDTIISELAQAADISIENDYSMLSDFVNRFDMNPSMWDVVQKTRNKYSVGLLTNMAPRMLAAINQRGLLPQLTWDVVVDSSEVGFIKPQSGIFEIAEKMAKVKPSELFFVDNIPENILAAQQRGWNAMIYDPRDPIVSSKKIQVFLDL